MHPTKYGYIQSPHPYYSDFPYYIPFQLYVVIVLLLNKSAISNECCTYVWDGPLELEKTTNGHTHPQDSPSHGSHHVGVGSGELVPHSWRMVTALILCQSLLI